jgi:hypothetical protein
MSNKQILKHLFLTEFLTANSYSDQWFSAWEPTITSEAKKVEFDRQFEV